MAQLKKCRGLLYCVVLDYDAQGNLVGIDIDNAKTKVTLEKLVVSSLPGIVETDAA